MLENYDKYLDLLHEKRFSALKHDLTELYEQDIAEFLETVADIDDVVRIFRLLPKSLGSDTFSYLDSDLQEDLIKKLSDKEISFIIEELSSDDAADLLEEMPANVARRILANATPETRRDVNRLLQYEDDTAGSIMTTEYIDFKLGMTAQQALNRIRKMARHSEQITNFFVTDARRVLKGVLSIRDLLLADPDEVIDGLMEDNIIYGETFTDQETLAHLFKKYDVLTVPIVDKEQRLVGIVTVDDIIDIINEEATEDISKMAAISSTDKPYLKTTAGAIFFSRIPWLLLLMVSATFTGIIINSFENALGNALLFACVPMLMGTGGNAGAQSSVTVIRGMSLNEVGAKDFFKVIWKELRVGLMSALLLGLVCVGKLMLIDNLMFNYPYDWTTSLVVGIALAVTVLTAKLVGCILPFFAKAVKLDPAVVANPFITTIIDVLSLLVFVFFSTLILA